jgi:2-succinyl-5-enolpyruvyl-6-hydroxy-3-cyclohexene-1-carboxylate synthase
MYCGLQWTTCHNILIAGCYIAQTFRVDMKQMESFETFAEVLRGKMHEKKWKIWEIQKHKKEKLRTLENNGKTRVKLE